MDRILIPYLDIDLKSAFRNFKSAILASPSPFALSLLFAMLLALCVAAEAQQPGKVYRVGYLSAQSPMGLVENALLHGLRDFGYVEGRNITIERRFAEGKLDRLPALAEELVHVKIDVMVTSSIQSTLAAKKATKTIPIVFAIGDNPVENGVVVSLARPGGNATGITDFADELSGKRVELLKEAVPKVSRLAVLFGSQTDQVMSTRGERSNLRLGCLEWKFSLWRYKNRRSWTVGFRGSSERGPMLLWG